MPETDCPTCGTTMICTPEGPFDSPCWCMGLPARLAVQKGGKICCLCPACTQRASKALELSETPAAGTIHDPIITNLENNP